MHNRTKRSYLTTVACFAWAALSASGAVYQEENGRVLIEAENFHARTQHPNDHHWHIVPTEDGTDFLADFGDPVFDNARGGVYVQSLPDTGFNNTSATTVGRAPALFYKVHITTPGTYRLWLRWRGHNGNSDSLYGQLVGFLDGVGGDIPDWYRYSQGSNLNFANSWQGSAGPELTSASGGNVPAVWEIEAPGVYTIKISHREDGCALDALAFQLESLPAPGEPGPEESKVATGFPPYVSVARLQKGPAGTVADILETGSGNVFPDTTIEIDLEDGGSSQIDPKTVKLTLNGTELAGTASKNGSVTTVTAKPASLLPAGTTHVLVLSYSDTSSPAKSFSNTVEFTTENYATLPPSLSRAAGSVSDRGFSIFVHQADTTSRLPNNTARAEAQLRGTLIDPATGKPYENQVVGGPNFTDDDVINWNQDAPAEIGNFNATGGKEDEPIPGIPGATGTNDDIAAEIIAFLELPAGLSRLGVNSDDGFRLTSAENPRDAGAAELGVFNGGRGSANSIFSVFAESAGIYPVRLIWYEGGGGANLEFFSVDLESGERILINDPSNPKALKAFRSSSDPKIPYAQLFQPLPGATDVNAGASILVELVDEDVAVDTASVKLTFDGAAVEPSVSKTGKITTISYDPPGLMASASEHTVVLTYSGTGASPRVFTREWKFKVDDYSSFAVVPAGFRMPSGSVNTNERGINVRMHQIEVARPGGNNLPAPLLQLADQLIDPNTGQPFQNLIDTSLETGWEGFTFKETGAINYNQDARDNPNAGAGSFRPDKPIPGIPGFGGIDHIAMEATTFLDLPAGVYRMVVNSDDGFIVSTALNPKDAFPMRLGLFDGGRGSADSIFNFVIEEPGLYPFSLIWWEGTGGANVEWAIFDVTTGERILVNDPNHPRAIKAYRVATLTRPYVQSISPLPGSFGQPVDVNLEVVLADGSIQVAPDSIKLTVNGASVSPVVTKSGAETKVSFNPAENFAPGADVNFVLTFSDTSTPPSSRSVTGSFTTDRPAVTFPPIEQDANGLIVVEAENFDARTGVDPHNWLFAKTPAGYTGQGAIYALPDVGGTVIGMPDALTLSPRVDYKIKFTKTGTHYFWYRGSDGGGDSVHAGIDDVDPTGTTMDNIDEGCCGSRAVGGTSWVWVGGIDNTPEGRASFEVTSPGVHTIHLWMREDGQIVDKFIITTDVNFAPAGAGPAESLREGGASTQPPELNPPTLQGGNITISWTGTGTLQVADAVTGPWSDAPNQGNPQSIAVTGTAKFFRVRQ